MSLSDLTHEQNTVIHELIKGNSIALLGAAGCGKSFLLSIIYKELSALLQKYNPTYDKPVKIQLCALTGCAALLLGHNAKTVHSWAGIGLGKGTVDEICLKIRKNSKSRQNWTRTDILVLDEISMMPAELFYKLNNIAKKMRKSDKPFGGIQLLVVGDFYQLPPVNRSNDATMFAFESDAWKECISVAIELTIIQRQKDPVFQNIVKEARVGCLSKESCEIIKSCQGRDWKNNKIRPTLLFPRRAEVDMINDSNLKALLATSAQRNTYNARLVYDPKLHPIAKFSENDESLKYALKAMDADAAYAVDLELVKDAQVMLIANIEPTIGLVNGSRGIVVGFCAVTQFPIVEFVNGIRKPIGPHNWPIEEYEFVMRTQIPLRLGFACTIHKAQGTSLDCALVDIGSSNFEYGQAYVALSRVRSLEALFVYDFNPTAFRVHPKVHLFYSTLTVIQHADPGEEKIDETDQVDQVDQVNQVDQVDQTDKLENVKKVEIILQNVENAVVNKMEEPGTNWLYDSIPDFWKEYLSSQRNTLQHLSNILSTKEFLPSRENIWSALIPIDSIKVVILGQDPYPTPGNAHGLAFSVLPDVKPLPASLKNIYKEIVSDIGGTPPSHGHLESWTKQGVLLLNTVLTVEAGAPQSHSKLGWEKVTDQIIQHVAEKDVIFILWGKSAQAKKKLLGQRMVIESAHPSPLSAHKGFFGTKPFSTVNKWLLEMGKEEINWI